MANLFGTNSNQAPLNSMLGNLAFQDKAYVSVDRVGIGSTFVDSGTAGQNLQVSGGAYINGNTGIGTTNPQVALDVVGNVRVTGVTTLGITSTTQLTTQNLNVSGISTVGNFLITPIGIGATVGGIGITYYGDGSKLQGVVSGINVQDEGTPVGTSVTTLNFTGVSVSISTAVGGISTVSVSSNYADNAGISTNLKGGLVGNIVYQSGVDATTFLTNGNSGYILQSNGVGAAPSWVAAAPSNAISGLTVQDNNSPVGTANAVTSINFVGSNIIATASGAGATITVSNNLVGTALSISGISTLGIVTSGNIFSTGIITASSFVRVGGSSTQFLKADGSIDSNVYSTVETDTLNSVTTRGNTTSNGISVGVLTATSGNFSGIITSSGANISGVTTITTKLDVGIGGTLFTVLSNGNIGVGSTNPISPLYVVGDGYFTGILTANRIVSTQYGEFTGGGISGTNIVGTSLSISGISTFSNGPVLIGSATSTGTVNQNLQVIGGASFTGTNYNVGIGTTNPLYTITVTDTGTPPTSGLTNCLADFTTTANSYGQINLRNTSTGTNASSDVIITSDNGSDTTNYIDLGINNSGFSVGSWTINGANDGYLYTSDGNLSIGAINASVAKYISFFTGGTLISNERMRINATGVGIGTTNPSSPLYVVGDGYFTGNISGNGSNLSGIVTSVVAGSNVNVSSSTGQVTISVTTLDMLEVMLFA